MVDALAESRIERNCQQRQGFEVVLLVIENAEC